MPWKRCPHCGGLSYSAATNRKDWPCPYCSKDLTEFPFCHVSPRELRDALRRLGENSPAPGTTHAQNKSGNGASEPGTRCDRAR